jgi:hypothetical protein
MLSSKLSTYSTPSTLVYDPDMPKIDEIKDKLRVS